MTRLYAELDVLKAGRYLKYLVNKSLRWPIHRFGSLSKPAVFETQVGVKYRFIRFDSNRFSEHIIQTVPFLSASISFSDLVMPPDLLKNAYTQCTQPVTQSAHYKLIEEICTETLTSNSEYIARSKMGTLDARLPTNPSLETLIHKCQTSQSELFGGKLMEIFVIKVMLEDRPAYVIADGKHRAALVAYHNQPQSLLLQVISAGFIRDHFFNQIYSYTLNMNPIEYSRNQEMIKQMKAILK